MPGVTAIDTHRVVDGQHRRVVLIHSLDLHADQARSCTGTTLANVSRQLDDLAATLARGKTRRTRNQLTTEIEKITHSPWVRAVIDGELTGDSPADRSLTWTVNDTNRQALENTVSGKRILITDHDDWPVTDVVAGDRSHSETLHRRPAPSPPHHHRHDRRPTSLHDLVNRHRWCPRPTA